ncbi:MAG: FlgN family protein [Gemmatimonadetes bacterium]|nr:FlgN family protein [Gemmatimonadota bacterium]
MSAHQVSVVEALPPARMPSAEMIADSLASEIALIEELVSIMQRQRASVAVNDLQAVDDTVYATHRVLGTLAESRRRRRSLSSMLGEREDLPLESLDHVLGDRMTESLRAVRSALHEAARTLSREVAINRHVLRSALASGDSYLRTLAGAPATATYSPVLESGSVARGSAVLNRRA